MLFLLATYDYRRTAATPTMHEGQQGKVPFYRYYGCESGSTNTRNYQHIHATYKLYFVSPLFFFFESYHRPSHALLLTSHTTQQQRVTQITNTTKTNLEQKHQHVQHQHVQQPT